MSDTKIKIDKDRLSDLLNEIKMAEAYNEEELKPILQESVDRYVGKHIPLVGGDWDILLNEIFPVVQYNLPSIFFRNPKVFLKPRHETYIKTIRDVVTGKRIQVEADSAASARTQESIANYQIEEIKYKREVHRILLDALLFPHGVLWHGYKGDFGMTEEKSFYIKDERVFVTRINPLDFLIDPSVSFSNFYSGDWCGRIIKIKYRDFIEDDRFNIDKRLIKGYKGYGDKIGTRTAISKYNIKPNDIADVHKTSILSYAEEGYRNSANSNFVKLYEIYLRPTKKEKREGKKGYILVLTDEQKEPLRINEWNIKAEGFPAKILMFNEVPDRKLGIHDISIYSSIADQKNVISNLQIRNAQECTNVWVGINKSTANEENIEKVEQGENTIIFFNGDEPIRDKMYVTSPGAQASNELYLIDQRIQRNLEDKSGVTDLKRGFLQSGEESAASVKLRAAGGAVRPAYRQDIMADFLKDSIHYIIQLNKQFLPYRRAVRIIGSLDIEWSENPSIEDIQADVDVEIDVTSMLPENPEEELKRYSEVLGLMTQAIKDPVLRRKIEEEGKMFNLTPLIEQILLRLRIKNPDIFRNIKPEESQGYVSVSEIRAAKANVEAALAGQANVPYPPGIGQDHLARIEVYSTVLKLIEELGDTYALKILAQLIQAHQKLAQEEMKKQPNVGQVISGGK